ncbi:MAG: hypothetical protein JXB48_22265 [Candidatus Latescibacteria bacterium]|nr:hypothetical protein [Candidatus Latescibacterota bacterium]
MNYLLLTIDYELFGYGNYLGDVIHHIINPAKQLIGLSEKYGIPFTFYFEIEEYIKFEKHSHRLKKNLGYDPAKMIFDNLQEIINSGNDVQLHVHPEWHRATYNNDKWFLCLNENTVDSLYKDQADTTNFIRSRKEIIETITSKSHKLHKIVAFRAGGFNARPALKLLPALRKNGIVFESSLVKGLYQKSPLGFVDYRKCPADKTLWRVDDDICMENELGLIYEIPIYSIFKRRFRHLTYNKIRTKTSKDIPKNKKIDFLKQLNINNPAKLIKYLMQKAPVKMDIHNQSPKYLINLLNAAIGSGHASSFPNIFVAIGHTKEHNEMNCKAIEQFLQKLPIIPDLQIITFTQLYNIFQDQGYIK